MLKHRHMIAGKPVFFGRSPKALDITTSDVEHGARRSQSACAAALAVQHCIPGAKSARVCLARTYVEYENKWEVYNTPNALRSELIAHDRDGRFAPGEYYIRPVGPREQSKIGRRAGSNKPGARDRGSKDRTPKKPRHPPHVVQGVRARGANR